MKGTAGTHHSDGQLHKHGHVDGDIVSLLHTNALQVVCHLTNFVQDLQDRMQK